MTDLKDILTAANQQQDSLLTYTAHPDLQRIELSVNELRNLTTSLYSKMNVDITKAHYLLANSGINADRTSNEIEALQLRDAANGTKEVDTDLESFVRLSRERSIDAVIAARRRQIQVDYRRFIDKHLEIGWEQRKKRMYEQFKQSEQRHTGVPAEVLAKQSTNIRSQSHRRMRPVVFDDVGEALPKSALWDAKAQTLAKTISSLNEHRLRKQPIAICSVLSEVMRNMGADVQTHQIADSWNALSFLTGESHNEKGHSVSSAIPKARKFANVYANGGTARNGALDTKIAQSSRRVLEDQFYGLVEREISRHPQEARLGGVPSPESKIKAFVNIRMHHKTQWAAKRLELHNSEPIWAIMFFLLRAGFVDEMCNFSKSNEAYLDKTESSWSTYLQHYASSPTRRLPRQLSERIALDYNHRLRSATDADPFKRALFKIIGRCELHKRSLPDVLTVTEDWMWLQLCLAQETEQGAMAHEQFTLSDLQASLIKLGPSYFGQRGSNGMLFFQLLLLSGQFEYSIQHLARHSYVDAVHFAIVLNYYGLLRIANTSGQSSILLLHEDGDSTLLNYADLLRHYIRIIQMQTSTTAVEYVACLTLSDSELSNGSQNEGFYSDVLREIVLTTRDFALLLGDVRTDGSREPGFIEKRLRLVGLKSEREYLRSITEHAAADSEAEGRTADAILLYHLAENFDTAVAIINNTLGETLLNATQSLEEISRASGQLAAKSDAYQMAKSMLQIYTVNAAIQAKISLRNRNVCEMLLQIAKAQETFSKGDVQSCLVEIDHTGLVPLSDAQSIGTLRRLAQDFDQLDASIARCVPTLLIMTVECLKRLYVQISGSSFEESTRTAKLRALQKQAKNVVLYSGLIRYNMDPETTAWIVMAAQTAGFGAY